jgi:peroxiredoxin
MRRAALCILAAALLVAHAAVAAAPDFQLRDTTGAMHSRADWRGAKAVVLVFVTTDCPVANSYVPEMNRIRNEYAARGVLMWAVQAETSTPEVEVARYATEYHYGFPLLLDPRQVLVQMTGATITPQAAVLSPDGKVLYLGRIDNRVEDFGKQRPKATIPDLRNALDAVLVGHAVAQPFTKSIGCAINRVK